MSDLINKPNLDILDFQSLSQALEVAEFIINAGMCPVWAVDKKANQPVPARVVLVLVKGKEIGFSVLQSLQHLYPVNGIVSMWGDGLLGFCLAQPDREYITETYNPNTKTFICKAKRKGREEIIRSFSFEQAEKAGYLDKPGPWKVCPSRMCQMRARSWTLRDTWADKLCGIIAYEEAVDYTKQSDKEISTIDSQNYKAIFESTREQLDFLISYNKVPSESIQKMLLWAGVDSIESMSELKAVQAIKDLEKRNPASALAWQNHLIGKIQLPEQAEEISDDVTLI